jgi:hypothetical protein
MKKIIIVLLFAFGCSQYQSTANAPEPSLRSRELRGPFVEISKLVYEATKKAYPDEIQNIKIEGKRKVILLREWFWRGDTVITITIGNGPDASYIISAESKPSWHRLNPTELNVSKKEVADYFTALDELYEIHLKNKQAND